MKILISAYACEPNTGSEHEIGWSWIKLHLKKGNKVFVITRKSNKKKIYKELKKKKIKNVNFLFYDLPYLLLKILKFKKKKSYIYFFLWQVGIYFKFRNFINSSKIDLIHHVTLGSVRIPSFLCFTKKKFIYGPLAGGEAVPKLLLQSFSFKSRLFEFLRKLSNTQIKYSFLLNKCFFNSSKILLANKETYNLINHRFLKKSLIVPNLFNKKLFFKIKSTQKRKIYYVGRLIDWKGIEIIKKIILNLERNNFKISFNIFGDGHLKNKLSRFILTNKISNNVKIYGQIEQDNLLKKIRENDLLIFPTLRDSGGYVILEALNNNINVITTNAAGPLSIIKKNEIGLINIHNKTIEQISNLFTKKIINFYNKKRFYKIILNNFMSEDYKYSTIYE